MFHNLAAAAPPAIGADTRVFVGDGTPYLPIMGYVPGTLQSVSCGGTVIPLEEWREVPIDASLLNLVKQRVPMVDVQMDGGIPILLRNQLSNDGIWQPGSRVFVTAKWQDAPDLEATLVDPTHQQPQDESDPEPDSANLKGLQAWNARRKAAAAAKG